MPASVAVARFRGSLLFSLCQSGNNTTFCHPPGGDRVIRHSLGRTAALIAATATLVAACSSGGTSTPAASAPASSTPASSTPGASAPDSSPAGAVPGPLDDAVTIHFGVFPNV